MGDPGRRALRLAQQALSAGRPDEVLQHVQPWLDVPATRTDAQHLTGLAFQKLGRSEDARRFLRRALRARPDSACLHHNLGGIHRERGELAHAASEFRRAIACDPGHAEAWAALADTQRFADPELFVQQIEARLASPRIARDRHHHLHFAAARVLDRMGQPDRAFPHFAEGNRLRARPYDFDRLERIAAGSRRFYTRERHLTRQARRRGPAAESRRPIFVVGMPRSGTSLVEQILASHTQVRGAGELPDLGCIHDQLGPAAGLERPPPEVFEGVPEAAFEGMAAAYLERLILREGDEAARVVDKHPLNFRFLGLATELFPHATVVHVQRDLRDSCFSCFAQDFSNGQEYSFDLQSLVRFAGLYLELMSVWREVLGPRLIELHYEDLVQSPSSSIEALLDRAGLPFEEACLRAHETRRSVRTASAEQVRQPIHATSIGRWRAYETQLGPLLDGLQRLETPS